MPRILFVCLGNICRSPAGESVLKKLAEERRLPIDVDSAGLGTWHLGKGPDKRMILEASQRGYQLSGVARSFGEEDFTSFDYIFAADQEIYSGLTSRASSQDDLAKIHLMSSFDQSYLNQDVPDPFYGEQSDFASSLTMIESNCQAILDHLISSSES